jgi:hypothetical protein
MVRGRQLKRQRNIILVATTILLLCLTIGYAAFSTTISLKAKGNVKYLTPTKLKAMAVTTGD